MKATKSYKGFDLLDQAVSYQRKMNKELADSGMKIEGDYEYKYVLVSGFSLYKYAVILQRIPS